MSDSKRGQAIRAAVDPTRKYRFDEAIGLLRKLSKVRFVEGVDISVQLGIEARKSDQIVRGSALLPHGLGRKKRVVAFCQDANVEKAKAAGADLAGLNEILEDVAKGKINFDVALATPDVMGKVASVGAVLGPRGLMPNPKDGTITEDIEGAVKNAKLGQVRYRADRNGIVHCPIGRIDFSEVSLRENLKELLSALQKAKPPSSKGVYMKKLFVSSTMGPGLRVDPDSVS